MESMIGKVMPRVSFAKAYSWFFYDRQSTKRRAIIKYRKEKRAMKANIKRLSGVLFALAMAVMCCPAVAFAAEEATEYVPDMYATFWALVPPIVAIALALITKEVYSSLFVGIVVGGLFYSGFGFEGTVLHVFEDGIVSVLSDSYNVGILVFLVILGTMVSLMNKAGGSSAFGLLALGIVRRLRAVRFVGLGQIGRAHV